jgi:hypothetical protein
MRSWEEILEPSERLGGPSAMGSSKYADFKKCPYYYHFKHVRRMTPVEYDSNLEIGGLYHEARARYYTAEGDPVQAAYDLITRAEEIVPATAGIVRRLFKGWVTLKGPGTPQDDRHLTKGVECLLEVTEPFHYSTRLDRWLLPDNGPIIEEAKTAGRYDERLRSSYRMDSQFLGQQYLWHRCMEDEYGPLAAYSIDLVIKTNPPQYPTEYAPVDYGILKNWEYEMQETARELERMKRSTRIWPRRRSYHSCRYCDLFNHCASNGQNLTGWRRKERHEY